MFRSVRWPPALHTVDRLRSQAPHSRCLHGPLEGLRCGVPLVLGSVTGADVRIGLFCHV